jgi:hypothetical protein
MAAQVCQGEERGRQARDGGRADMREAGGRGCYSGGRQLRRNSLALRERSGVRRGKKSHLPGDRQAWIRRVCAVGTGLDGGCEVLS